MLPHFRIMYFSPSISTSFSTRRNPERSRAPAQESLLFRGGRRERMFGTDKGTPTTRASSTLVTAFFTRWNFLRTRLSSRGSNTTSTCSLLRWHTRSAWLQFTPRLRRSTISVNSTLRSRSTRTGLLKKGPQVRFEEAGGGQTVLLYAAAGEENPGPLRWPDNLGRVFHLARIERPTRLRNPGSPCGRLGFRFFHHSRPARYMARTGRHYKNR